MALKQNQLLISLLKSTIIIISIYVILNYSGVDALIYVSTASFGFLLGSIVPISLVFYLTPITKTIYD